MADRHASLLHRGGRESRKSDHVAGSVDRRRRRSIVLVHLDVTSLIQVDSGTFQTQLFDNSPAASCKQSRFHLESLSGLKRDSHTVIGAFDLRHTLAEIESNAEIRKALAQTFC